MNYLVLLTEGAEAVSEATQTQGGSWLSMVGMIAIYGVIIFAMWFFFMRPQKKEQKRVKEMLDAMDVGDCVLTTSGFYGIIIDISDDTVIVEFGNNRNCRIPMDKSAISRVEKADQGSGSES